MPPKEDEGSEVDGSEVVVDVSEVVVVGSEVVVEVAEPEVPPLVTAEAAGPVADVEAGAIAEGLGCSGEIGEGMLTPDWSCCVVDATVGLSVDGTASANGRAKAESTDVGTDDTALAAAPTTPRASALPACTAATTESIVPSAEGAATAAESAASPDGTVVVVTGGVDLRCGAAVPWWAEGVGSPAFGR